MECKPLRFNQLLVFNFFQVHWSLKELMTDVEQTNLEKTLLQWCKQNTQACILL